MSLSDLIPSLEALSLNADSSAPPGSAAHKRALGQFYTTNYAYILTGMSIPSDTKCIIEPFCGAGHLLQFIHKSIDIPIECYDLDPKTPDTVLRDSIMDPPDYAGAFILTNPPYLARNKCADKTAFDKYNANDLYKCFIVEIERQKCSGGIVILPLNFWCSIRKADVALRATFLNKYEVSRINVFEERVFEDTSYAVCSFQFSSRAKRTQEIVAAVGEGDSQVVWSRRRKTTILSPSASSPEIVQFTSRIVEDVSPFPIPITIFPSMAEISAELNSANSYLIGGDIYELPVKGRYRISRLTSKNADCVGRTLLRAKCIDDSAAKCIALEIVSESDVYIDTTPGQTARTYASLSIIPEIDVDTQKMVAARFNELLNSHRVQFRSLFMANFRESKDVARKRISFDLVYRITEHVLDEIDAEVA